MTRCSHEGCAAVGSLLRRLRTRPDSTPGWLPAGPLQRRRGLHHAAEVGRVSPAAVGLLHVDGWDLLIAHPPCTLLARAGARWWKGREAEQARALAFVRALMAAPIPRIAVENPPGKVGTAIRSADQYIQPWQFGQQTGLWLKGLPLLKPTAVVAGRAPRVHYAAPGPDRW